MIYAKDGIDGTGVKPELIFNLFLAEPAYQKRARPMVVTSLVRPSGGLGESLHPSGLAADLRIRSIDETWPGGLWEITDVEELAAEIRELCPQCQIVVESDHIHMEYQP
jgi:hypothetical protein